MNILKIIKKLIAPVPNSYVRYGLDQADIQDARRKWDEIQTNMSIGKPSNFKIAIMEADKLLDHVLQLYGYRGQTMGDRMKAIPRKQFGRDFFDDMWQAHILRNKMSHAMDYEVQHFEARDAIKKFERVLRDLEVL